MATPTVYVICDNNCKWEGMTKEQILAAIAQAVSTGEIKDVDAGFVQTIKTINGVSLKFFVGEQSEFDALPKEEQENLFAIITNDKTKDELVKMIEGFKTDLQDLNNGLASGTIVPKKAGHAGEADKAKNLAKSLVGVEVTTSAFPVAEAGLYCFYFGNNSFSGTSIIYIDGVNPSNGTTCGAPTGSHGYVHFDSVAKTVSSTVVVGGSATNGYIYGHIKIC